MRANSPRRIRKFANGPLLEREQVLDWRAITALMDEGVTAMIVPFCDKLHQPYGNEHLALNSDGTTLDDRGPYCGGGSSEKAGLGVPATRRRG